MAMPYTEEWLSRAVYLQNWKKQQKTIIMYIEDKEEFRKQMLYFANNWLDKEKVKDPIQKAFAKNYMSPSSQGFYILIMERELDDYYTKEACEFFYDNAKNPNMIKQYPVDALAWMIKEWLGIGDLDEEDSELKLFLALTWLDNRFGGNALTASFSEIEKAIKNEYIPNQ